MYYKSEFRELYKLMKDNMSVQEYKIIMNSIPEYKFNAFKSSILSRLR